MIIIETPAPPTRERLVLVPLHSVSREANDPSTEPFTVHTNDARDATPADLERAGYVTTAPGDYYSQWTDERDRAEKAEASLAAAQAAFDESLTGALDRAERAERERDEALGRAQSETEWRVRAVSERQDAEAERDTLRAELARLTAPGEGSEGEPTYEALGEHYRNAWDASKAMLEMGRRHDAYAALYRLGVAHERARQQPAKDRATDEELVSVFTGAYCVGRGGTHPEGCTRGALAVAAHVRRERCDGAGLRRLGGKPGESVEAFVTRLLSGGGFVQWGDGKREERCLVAQAVAANVDIRVCEDDGGGFMVGVHAPGCDEELTRCVPPADVPATLARLLGEVSRG